MTKTTALYATLFICVIALLAGCASDEEKAQKLLEEGRTYFEQQDYDKAKIQFQNVLQLDPKSIQAHDFLSKIYLKKGNAKEASSTFLRLEQLDPDNLDYKLQVASFFLLSGKRPEAARRVEAVLEKEPENIQALYLHAGILGREKQDLDSIKEVYEQILAIDDTQIRAYLALSRIHAALNNMKQAEAVLNRALEAAPDSIDVHKSLFNFYLAQKEEDKAESVLDSLISRRPEEIQPLMIAGNFMASRGRVEEAEKQFLAAIDLDPDHFAPHMSLARLLSRQGETREAETHIQKALAIEPDNFEVKTAYGEFLFATRQLDKAGNLVDEILEKRPNYQAANQLKGRLLAAKNEYDAALPIFQTLVKDEPESARYNFLLGSAHFSKREFDQAKPFLAKALEKNPRLLQARMMMAKMYFRQGDLYLAEDNTKQILEKIPHHYEANLLMGDIAMGHQEHAEARTLYEKMADRYPDKPPAWYKLGLLDRSRNDADSALAHFDKALALNPYLMDVFTHIIRTHASQKEYRRAIRRCDAHLEKTADKPVAGSVILNLKANLMLAQNKESEGKVLLEQAIEKNPGHVTPYMTLARLYKMDNDLEKALETYKALTEKRPDQAVPFGRMGVLYEKLGQPDKAETAYKSALDIDPEYLPAVNNLAYLYAEQYKELNKALDLARQAKERLGRVPAVMDTLGWVYYKRELYDMAIAEFKACVEKEPANPIFQYHLGLTQYKLGNFFKSEAALKKALELQKDFPGAADAREVLSRL